MPVKKILIADDGRCGGKASGLEASSFPDRPPAPRDRKMAASILMQTTAKKRT